MPNSCGTARHGTHASVTRYHAHCKPPVRGTTVTVSLVPRLSPTSPGDFNPSPATEHGLSPDHATTAQSAGNPYLAHE